MNSLDDRLTLLARVPREIYESRRSIGDALELVFSADDGVLTANMFPYDWSRRLREKNEPLLKQDFILTEKQASISEVYQHVTRLLVEQGYFVEEKDAKSILFQLLASDAASINARVDNFIEHLKATKSPILERPKLRDTEEAYRQWLLSYHEQNSISLPPSFPNLGIKGLRGMFYGITEPERIEKRLREKQFVIELYMAHAAMLPIGFDKLGHKQIGQLHEKLNRWYGAPAQADLFR